MELRDAILKVLGLRQKPAEDRTLITRHTLAEARKHLNVLLVEDNLVNQELASRILRKRGHDVTIVANGKLAVEALEKQRFDVVLMDVQMPELGGLEATAAIRQRERESGAHTCIVAMTAHAMTGDRERCLAAGMDDYLSKPIDPTALYTMLEHRAAASGPSIVPDLSPSTLTIDHDLLMKRLGGDLQLRAEVVQAFLEDCPVRLAAIRAAVDSRDAERIRTTAHALKGAAGNMSAQGLFDAAATLERIGAEGRLDAADAAWRALSVAAANVIDVLTKLDTTPTTKGTVNYAA